MCGCHSIATWLDDGDLDVHVGCGCSGGSLCQEGAGGCCVDKGSFIKVRRFGTAGYITIKIVCQIRFNYLYINSNMICCFASSGQGQRRCAVAKRVPRTVDTSAHCVGAGGSGLVAARREEQVGLVCPTLTLCPWEQQ